MKARNRNNPKAAKAKKAKAKDPWEGATNVVKITMFEIAPLENPKLRQTERLENHTVEAKEEEKAKTEKAGMSHMGKEELQKEPNGINGTQGSKGLNGISGDQDSIKAMATILDQKEKVKVKLWAKWASHFRHWEQ